MGQPIPRDPSGKFRVFYPDLGGGRNTRKSAHKIGRDELAASINGWIPAANSFGKRPGNTAFIGNGTTGSGAAGSGMATVRFNSQSYALVQTAGTIRATRQIDSAWATIATGVATGAKLLNAAQLYDPASGVAADAAYLVNGVDAPRRWIGSGSCVTLTTSSVPTDATGSAPIAPAYVATLLGRLFYAGDATRPSALYISDPLTPESFTYGGQLPGASYSPFIIGSNDGVGGGKITGIAPLGKSMLVYKESAIYRFDFTGTYGDVGPFSVTLISANVGCVAPKSLASFDTFHVFLGVDGVYTCGLEGISTRPISDNNPDLFEGPNAACVDRTTAVGGRYGPRYLIFFDNGGV